MLGQVGPLDDRREGSSSDTIEGPSFVYWMEALTCPVMVAAGTPRIRRKLYIGHEITDLHDHYEGHEVKEFLEEDAARLRGFHWGKG